MNQPFFWGALLSATYYALMFQPAFEESVLKKYTTEHLTEYVIVSLFFWAVADLTLRYLGLARERRAITSVQLPPREGQEPVESAASLAAQLDDAPAWWQDTKMGRRLRRALNYVNQRQSAQGFREYMQTLAEEDANETHSNYGFARFVSALAPVLGLLGTVVHFGVALGGLSMDHLMEKLPDMLSHMGTAFNTTCVALSASMSVLFLLFLVERVEERIVRDVNGRTEHDLLNRFTEADASLTPFLDAVQAAKQVTLAAMEEFQKAEAERWQTAMADERTRWQANDAQREAQLKQVAASIGEQQTAHATHMTALVERMSELNNITKTAAEMIGSEKRLAGVQTKLAENLDLLHRSQKFEEALHSLTAAIHLLTARPAAGSAKKAA